MVSVRSGIGTVEEAWGGLRRGRLYLLLGAPGLARHRLALQVAMAGEEGCLLLSPRPLKVAASPLAPALREAVEGGRLRLLSAAPEAGALPDGARALEALAGIVRQEMPARLVFDELSVLLPKSASAPFEGALRALLTTLAEADTTTVLVLDAPAEEHLLAVLGEDLEGTIRLQADGSCTLEPAEAPGATSAEALWRLRLDRLARPLEGHGRPPPAQEQPPALLEAPEPSGDGNASEEAPVTRPPPPETRRAAEEPSLPGVRFFDLEGLPRPRPRPALAEDPFARETLPSGPADRPAEAIPEGEDPFAYVLPSAEEEAEPTLLDALAPPGPERLGRAAFAAAFDAAVRAWEMRGHAFLALGLRLSAGFLGPRPLALLTAGLALAMGEEGHLFVDEGQRCAAILMPGRRAEAAPALLRRLAVLAEASLGAEAPVLLASTATSTAANGHPFRTGDAFLRHLCKED